MLTLHLEQVLTQIVAFIVMYWVLKRYAWKPLLNVLEARKQSIAEEFKQIEQEKRELEQLKTEYLEKLSQVAEQARAKIEEGINQGKAQAMKIEEEAHRKALILYNKAKDDIEIEIAKGKEHLKKEVAGLAIALAQKILSENLDEKMQLKLLTEFIHKAELE